MNRCIILFFPFFLVNGFLQSFSSPVKTYIRSFDNKELNDIKVVEPYYISKRNTTAILFLTGGSATMTSDIYSNFLDELAVKKFSTYSLPRGYKNTNILINELFKEYNNVIFMGHSSGGTTAINKCKNISEIKTLILLDGVDTSIFSLKSRYKDFNLKYINNLLFLNAGKSYKWTYDPPGIPFIPFLSIKKKLLELKKNCKVIEIQTDDFGHSDILDRPYSNLMHYTRLSVGYKNRSMKNLRDYHIWLASVIDCFYNNKLSKLDNLIN